jgi:hypothetical protein
MSVAGRIDDDAHIEWVEDCSLGTFLAISLTVKGFTVGIASLSFGLSASTELGHFIPRVAAGTGSVEFVVGEARWIDDGTNSLRVEDGSLGALLTDVVDKFEAIWIAVGCTAFDA